MLLGEIFERESRTKPNDRNGAGGIGKSLGTGKTR